MPLSLISPSHYPLSSRISSLPPSSHSSVWILSTPSRESLERNIKQSDSVLSFAGIISLSPTCSRARARSLSLQVSPFLLLTHTSSTKPCTKALNKVIWHSRLRAQSLSCSISLSVSLSLSLPLSHTHIHTHKEHESLQGSNKQSDLTLSLARAIFPSHPFSCFSDIAKVSVLLQKRVWLWGSRDAVAYEVLLFTLRFQCNWGSTGAQRVEMNF